MHGPSFLAGILLGAGTVALVVLAPGLLSEQFPKLPAITPVPDELDIVFEFPELLRGSEVPVNPGPYADPTVPVNAMPVEPGPGNAAPTTAPGGRDAAPTQAQPVTTTRIYIQAASFRDAAEAEQLRARLLLEGLPASMGEVVLENGAWHRVTIGPFGSAIEAEKIVARLRKQNLSAIPVNRG